MEAGWNAGKLSGVSELVLQPNVGEDFVRRWLVHRGYVLQAEMLLEEDSHLYEILHARVSAKDQAGLDNKRVYDTAIISAELTDAAKSEWLYRMGPFCCMSPLNC